MPKLKREIMEERYREINDEYQKFSYEITQYGIDSEYKKKIQQIAMRLRLLLRKFI